MSLLDLLGLGGVKAFVSKHTVNGWDTENPIFEFNYILVLPDDTCLYNPLSFSPLFNDYVPITYQDTKLSIELKVKQKVWDLTGDPNLNVVFVM